jgi:TRAP-type C4-dicarboxylate transport system substrate-binding protein
MCVIISILLIGFSKKIFSNYNVGTLSYAEQAKNIEFERDEIEDIKVIKIAHSFPEYHPQHRAIVQKFAQIVGEESDWKIIVEIFPNDELGNESQYIKGVQNGTIEMCIGGESLIEYVPTLRVMNFPYIFENYDEMRKVLNSNLINDSFKQIEELGMHALAWSFNGVNQISTFEKDIAIQEDTSLQIATTTSNEDSIEALEEIGFDIYHTDNNSLSSILKQRQVDGHATSMIESFYNGWYDDQTKLFVFNYSFNPTMYIISDEFWNELTYEEKNIIQKAAEETAEYELEILETMEENIYKNLTKMGMNIELLNLNVYKDKIQLLYNGWINGDDDLQEAYNKLINLKKTD